MKRFAALIDRLIYTRSRNSKLALIVDYLRHTPDPDRGWALAALTEALDFPAVKAGTVRTLLSTRVDEELFRLAEDGRLLDPKALAGQVERMLDDPRSRTFIAGPAGRPYSSMTSSLRRTP